ncbi:MAG: thiolase domain-containing protein [Anaerolineae bacterium]|nr:thiolase domain-containing protein [Anaerolineae bacterium]
MQQVAIVGVGQTPVGEHWELSLRQIALQAMQAAMRNAGVNAVDAIVVGNALGGVISGQNHVGALVADFAGMRGCEAFRVEAADASGGMALRQGYLMVASGLADTVMVLGVEKVTDLVGSGRIAALASTLDAEYEAAQGATPVALAALLMRRYMHEYGVQVADFANFSVTAHANGSKNPNAMYRNLIKGDRFASAPLVADPVNLFDVAPEADGAAAIILTTAERAADLVPQPIYIIASTVGTDTLAVHDRPDPLFLTAANLSAGRAYEQAGITSQQVDILELHDSATIMAALALEANGFAGRGEGWKLAANNEIGNKGRLPISTFGGLKSRGNPLGATGVYQAVEVTLQLRGEAGANQVDNIEIGMTQNLGGLGATAVTHLLARE